MRLAPLLFAAASAACLWQGALGAWDWAFYWSPYRYRLAVEAEIDGHVRQGATVVELRDETNRLGAILPQGWPWFTRARCEALYVKLGDGPGDNLFVLIARDAIGLPNKVILGPNQGGFLDKLGVTRRADLEAARGRTFDVAPDLLPMMARFRDIGDPSSLEPVAPSNLAARYGRGARLVRAILTITDAPVGPPADKALPWLSRLRSGEMLDGEKGLNIWRPGLDWVSSKTVGYDSFVCLP